MWDFLLLVEESSVFLHMKISDEQDLYENVMSLSHMDSTMKGLCTNLCASVACLLLQYSACCWLWNCLESEGEETGNCECNLAEDLRSSSSCLLLQLLPGVEATTI